MMTDAARLHAAHGDVTCKTNANLAAPRGSKHTLVLRRVAVIGFSRAADFERTGYVLVHSMFGSNKLKATINWLVLSADRQLAEDRQCDNRGIELADAYDVLVVYRDRKRVFLD